MRLCRHQRLGPQLASVPPSLHGAVNISDLAISSLPGIFQGIRGEDEWEVASRSRRSVVGFGVQRLPFYRPVTLHLPPML